VQITAPHSSADHLGPSPQGLLLWEVQPSRRRTAWLPSSCRAREGCPPSCHPGSREERALMRCLHDGIQPQPGRALCRQCSLLLHTVTAWPSAQRSPQMLSLCNFWISGLSLSPSAAAFGEQRCMQEEPARCKDVENPVCGKLLSA